MFNLIANGKGGANFKFTRDNLTLAYDGNSIAFGEGSSYLAGHYPAYAVSEMPMFKRGGVRCISFAIGGQTITAILAKINQIRQLYDPRHFNLLIVDEITNELYNLTGTPSAMASATLAKILDYNTALKAGGQKWTVVWHSAVPRGVSASLGDPTYNKNLGLQLVNQALRDNPALYGVDIFADSCFVGSPFRQFTNFTQAEFDAVAAYYRPAERSATNGGTFSFTADSVAGSINLTNVRPTIEGYTPWLQDVLNGYTVSSSAISSGTLSTATGGLLNGLIRLNAATNLQTATQALFTMTRTGYLNLNTHLSDLGYSLRMQALERELRNLGTKLLLQ